MEFCQLMGHHKKSNFKIASIFHSFYFCHGGRFITCRYHLLGSWYDVWNEANIEYFFSKVCNYILCFNPSTDKDWLNYIGCILVWSLCNIELFVWLSFTISMQYNHLTHAKISVFYNNPYELSISFIWICQRSKYCYNAF